jgi:hypothetical protein
MHGKNRRENVAAAGRRFVSKIQRDIFLAKGVPNVAGEAMIRRESTTNKENLTADNEARRPQEVSGKGEEKSQCVTAHMSNPDVRGQMPKENRNKLDIVM